MGKFMSESRIFDPKHVLGFRIQVPHIGAKLTSPACGWAQAFSLLWTPTQPVLSVYLGPTEAPPSREDRREPCLQVVLQTGLPVPAVLASMLPPAGLVRLSQKQPKRPKSCFQRKDPSGGPLPFAKQGTNNRVRFLTSPRPRA